MVKQWLIIRNMRCLLINLWLSGNKKLNPLLSISVNLLLYYVLFYILSVTLQYSLFLSHLIVTGLHELSPCYNLNIGEISTTNVGFTNRIFQEGTTYETF